MIQTSYINSIEITKGYPGEESLKYFPDIISKEDLSVFRCL